MNLYPNMKHTCTVDGKSQNTLKPGSFTQSEDTRRIFSGFRSVWIKHKSCISAEQNKEEKQVKQHDSIKTPCYTPWTKIQAKRKIWVTG